MTITRRDRDLGTAYAMTPPAARTEFTSTGGSSPTGAAAPSLAHGWSFGGCQKHPQENSGTREDLILFRNRLRPAIHQHDGLDTQGKIRNVAVQRVRSICNRDDGAMFSPLPKPPADAASCSQSAARAIRAPHPVGFHPGPILAIAGCFGQSASEPFSFTMAGGSAGRPESARRLATT